MKQIFNWMREQMRTEYNLLHLEEPNGNKFEVIELEDAEVIINEAEAKWEADCCEYEYHVAPSKDIYYLTSCKRRHNGMLWDDEPYCRYCGKPIEISEVE